MARVGSMSEQQKRVYAAESILGGGTRFQDYAEAQAYADSITSSDWWATAYPNIVRLEVFKLDATSTSCARQAEERGAGEIHLAPTMLNVTTLLHEAAHCAAPKGVGHEAAWARTFMTIVYRALGTDEYMRLYTAYKNNNVDIG